MINREDRNNSEHRKQRDLPKERKIRSEIGMAGKVSTEAPKVRRPLSNAFKSLQENYPQLKILYPTKLSIKFEIKKKKRTFPVIEMLLND